MDFALQATDYLIINDSDLGFIERGWAPRKQLIPFRLDDWIPDMKNRQRIIFLYPSGFPWRSLAKPLQPAFIQPNIQSVLCLELVPSDLKARVLFPDRGERIHLKKYIFGWNLNDNIVPAKV